MSQPDNGAAAAPSPAPAAAAPPPRRVAAMSAKKSFPATSGVEKLKSYLREVPKLHDQLTQVIEALRVTSDVLRKTTEDVQRLVKQWEEEQKHGRPEGVPGAGAPAAPSASAPAPAPGPAAPSSPGAGPGPGAAPAA